MKDWRGTPIEVGCTIVYPGRHSSHLWMNESVVDSVEPGRLTVRKMYESGLRGRKAVDPKLTVLTSLERITVVDS